MMSKESQVIDNKRRKFMKGALGLGAAGFVVGSGLISASAFAAAEQPQWPEEAFAKEDIDSAIETLYGQSATESDKIKLDMPTIAQNGAVVPVTVKADLPNVTSIALLVTENPFALTAKFNFPEGTLPFVSNRIKMGETSDVIALVESEGKLYKAKTNVKVTVGGCGG